MTDQEILNNAPPAATHVTGCGAYLTTCKESGEYLFRRADDYEWQCFGLGYTVDDLTRSLADIRRIVELEERVYRLEVFIRKTIEKWGGVEELEPTLTILKRVLKGEKL